MLVIAIDGLRADHVNLPGPDGGPNYDRQTTPSLAALARSGVAFAQCFTAAPERIPAHAAILSGCDPRVVRRPPAPSGEFLALAREWRLPATLPSLARELLAAGFRTAAFVDDPNLDERLGFASGFETFQRFPQQQADGVAEGIASISERLVGWLREMNSDRDWFAYITAKDLERVWMQRDPVRDTYFEPRPELSAVPPVSSARYPYFAIPVDHWDGGLHTLGEHEARYDGGIRQVDAVLQRLFRQLQERGMWETTTVIVVGTYGVGLGENGLYLMSGSLADVDLHVPCVVKPPASWTGPRGVRSEHLMSTIDLMPTVLELCGLPPVPGVHGVSQAGAALPGAVPARRYAFASGGVVPGFAVRTAEYSFQRTRPGASSKRDFVTTWSGLRHGFEQSAREFLSRRGPGADPGDLGPSLDLPEVVAELRAAGEDWYLWLDHARDALHEVPWMERPVEPEVLEELVRRGLIAPEARP